MINVTKKEIVEYKGKYFAIERTKGFIDCINSKGWSKCHPEDEFDLEFGLKLAYAREMGDKEEELRLIKEVNKDSAFINGVIASTIIESNIYENFGIKCYGMEEKIYEEITKTKMADGVTTRVELTLRTSLMEGDFIGIAYYKSRVDEIVAINLAETKAKVRLYRAMEDEISTKIRL